MIMDVSPPYFEWDRLQLCIRAKGFDLWLSLIPILNSLRSFKQPYKPCSLRFANRFTKNSGMVLDRLMVQVRILHQSLSILGLSALTSKIPTHSIMRQLLKTQRIGYLIGGDFNVFKTRLAVYKFEGDELAWWKAYEQTKKFR
ncbi:hypothetical protein Tco_0877796 [Tanacetum coccineum]|uniref:Uncharacterized protein n=1 Tax=Tanacetum coccineum TaxID=301880 RepID=A0ABQ5BW25_9ASTR